MKFMKATTVLILLVMCASFVFGTRGYATESVNIVVTMVNQDPDPVEPGQYVDVRFKLENLGSSNAEDVEVEIVPEFPFSLPPGESAIKEVGSIHGRQTGDVGAIVKYRLLVDKSAVEGTNDIALRLKFSTFGWITLDDFSVNVRPSDAILAITSVSSTPNQIQPGDTAIVSFSLKNLESITIKDIKVNLDLTGLSLAPVGSSSEKVIYTLDPNKETKVDFELMADAEAASGLNKLPVTIYYKDQLNNNYTISSDIGVLVGAPPDVSVTLDSTDITQSGKNGEVTIKFVNKGVADIKFLNVNLKETNEITLLSSDTVYIGNIDSDDYETADFDIRVKQTEKTEIDLPLVAEYKDANNKDYKEEINLKLKLYSATQAKELGLVQGNGKVGIVIVVVIVIVGLAIFLYWRKKRKK